VKPGNPPSPRVIPLRPTRQIESWREFREFAPGVQSLKRRLALAVPEVAKLLGISSAAVRGMIA
jgi:hypothetical protein